MINLRSPVTGQSFTKFLTYEHIQVFTETPMYTYKLVQTSYTLACMPLLWINMFYVQNREEDI